MHQREKEQKSAGLRFYLTVAFFCLSLLLPYFSYAAIYTGGSYGGDDSIDTEETMFQGGSYDGFSQDDYTTNTYAGFGGDSYLSFTTEPVDTRAGHPFTQQPVVKIYDEDGNLITVGADATQTITISISTNPGNGTLSGDVDIAAVAGIATFTDLEIDEPAEGYVLQAVDDDSGCTSDTSNLFNVFSEEGYEVQFGIYFQGGWEVSCWLTLAGEKVQLNNDDADDSCTMNLYKFVGTLITGNPGSLDTFSATHDIWSEQPMIDEAEMDQELRVEIDLEHDGTHYYTVSTISPFAAILQDIETDVDDIETDTATINWADIDAIKAATDTINWADITEIGTTLDEVESDSATIRTALGTYGDTLANETIFGMLDELVTEMWQGQLENINWTDFDED